MTVRFLGKKHLSLSFGNIVWMITRQLSEHVGKKTSFRKDTTIGKERVNSYQGKLRDLLMKGTLKHKKLNMF